METVICAILLLAVSLQSSVARPTINSPCGSRSDATYDLFQSWFPVIQSPKVTVDGILTKMDEVMDMIVQMKTLYREDGARSDPRDYDEIDRESRHLANFPSEVQRIVNVSSIDLTDTVSRDYLVISTVMVFFDLGFNDSNGRYQSIADQYRNIKTKLLAILCSMSKISENVNATIKTFTIISEEDRSLVADTDRHARDYTAVKDSYVVFKTLRYNYDRISAFLD